jgi:hypothetical protein
LFLIENKYDELIHSVYVTISYAFNTCFLAKKKRRKERAMKKKTQEKKKERNKHNKRRFHDSRVCDDARVVRLCNTYDR